MDADELTDSAAKFLQEATCVGCSLSDILWFLGPAILVAAAHVIVQGQAVSALTFLPGIVLGWLFIRTKSLLAPILFHGLANTCYCIMTVALS